MNSTAYTQVMNALKVQREELQAQLTTIEQTLGGLERLTGTTREEARTVSPLVSERPKGPRKPRQTKTGAERKPRRIEPAPTPTPSAPAAALTKAEAGKQRKGPDGLTPKQRGVVEAVRTIGPTSIEALATHLGLNIDALKFHLKSLLASGHLLSAGVGRDRLLRVPTSAPAAAPASGLASLDPAAIDAGVVAIVRRQASTFEELAAKLLPTRSADNDLLLKRSLRRLTLKDQVADVGLKFVAV